MMVRFLKIRPVVPIAAVVAFSFLVRLAYFGDPAPDFDEQFYFLVGSRLLSGELPYVDIWDRKPILIFIINAVASALGGGEPWVVQVFAASAASLGGVQIYLIGRRFGDGLAGVAAAALFLLSFPLFWSPVAQSEVFYIPALLGVLQIAIGIFIRSDKKKVFALSCWLMLLGGLSLQIKYTTLPCCLVAAVAVLMRLRRLGHGWPRLAGDAGVFALIGLTPTLVVISFYAAVGHFDEFWFANFVSIFGRGGLTGAPAMVHVVNVIVHAALPTVLAVAGMLHFAKLNHAPDAKAAYWCVVGYTVTALAGFAMVGTVYSHYFLPVVPGLVLLAVPVFSGSNMARAVAFVAVATTVYAADFPSQFTRARQDKDGIGRAVALIRPRIDQEHCLFVYDGPSILYQLTRSCLPGTYVYPDHLNNMQESRSIGVDQAAEIRRILARRPGAIVIAQEQVVPQRNAETTQLVRDALRTNYRLAGRTEIMGRITDIYALQ